MMTAAGVDGVEPVSKRGKGEGSGEKVTTAAGVRARTRRRGMMTAAGVDGVEPVSKLGKGEGGRVEKATTAAGVNGVEHHHGPVRYRLSRGRAVWAGIYLVVSGARFRWPLATHEGSSVQACRGLARRKVRAIDSKTLQATRAVWRK